MENYRHILKVAPSPLNGLHLLLLKGGIGSELSVSLLSGTVVADALCSRGDPITEVDIPSQNLELSGDIDPFFNTPRSTFGKDGYIQAILSRAAMAIDLDFPSLCKTISVLSLSQNTKT